MIDRGIGPVNTDLLVVPAYGTPEAAIVQPERHAPLSLYAVHRWLPRLGAQRLALVLVLRSLAFDAPTASDGTRRITVSREALAAATGVANAGTVGEWLRSEPIVGGGGWRRLARSSPEAEALAHFVPRLRYAYSGNVRTGLIVCVRMDDPLAPEDEAAAERIRVGQQTAAASQLAFTSVPPLPPGVKAVVPPSAANPDAKAALPSSVQRAAAVATGSPPDVVLAAAGKAAAPLSDARREAPQPPSPAPVTAAELTSAQDAKATQPSSEMTAKMVPATSAAEMAAPSLASNPPAALKAGSPPVNVNANDTSLNAPNEALGNGHGAALLAAAVERVHRGLMGSDARRTLAPLVTLTAEALGDAGSDAFYAKAYLALYGAGRLDIAVAALGVALDGGAERPGAVFTATLKELCREEGVALGLKQRSGERRYAEVGSGGASAAQDEWQEGEAATGARGLSREEARLWQDARVELEASMAHSTYDTWLRNCEAVEVRWQDPLTVVLAFPHQTAREWVSQRLRLTVERALSRAAGRPAAIECVVGGVGRQ